MSDSLLSVRSLRKEFVALAASGSELGRVTAVDDVSFELARGETLALVGESGSGKSTVLNLIAQLIPASGGSVSLEGVELTKLQRRAMRARRRELQFVFQNPHTSLNPSMSVAQIVAEPLAVHRVGDRQSRRRRVAELLELVGLGPQWAQRSPSALSGGQAQRVSIARALALEPKLLLLDEPTSALDVSIQAQIVLLLAELQQRLGLAYLFVSHNLAVVASIAKRIAVMQTGRIVEVGELEGIYSAPAHPYTRSLLAATLDPEQELARRSRARQLPHRNKGDT